MVNAVYKCSEKSVNAKVAASLGIESVDGKYSIEGVVSEDSVEILGNTVSFTLEVSDIPDFPLLKLHTYNFDFNGSTRTFQDPQPLSNKGIVDKAFWLIHKVTKSDLGITKTFGARTKDPLKVAIDEQYKAYKASLKTPVKKEKKVKPIPEVKVVDNF